jgi:YgiT-type zinc finger domain-containing protein
VPPLSISRIRNLLRTLRYVVSLHAAEKMEDEGFTILDVENIIFTGTIFERQKTSEPFKPRSSSAASRSTAAKRRSSSKSANPASSMSSRSIPLESVCAACGHGVPQLRRVTRSFGTGRTLLVIERIPMWSCSRCGESYFTARTMHEIERIKALRNSVAEKRRLAVAEFEEEGAPP